MFNELWYVEFNHKTHGRIKLAGMRKPSNDIEMQSLKNNDVISIISLLSDTENHELYTTNAMNFLWLSVKGGGAPDRVQVEQANDHINTQLAGNTTAIIATHCNGGRKRTGTLIAGVMVLNGVNPETAIEKVETANTEIKLSDAQREFLFSLV